MVAVFTAGGGDGGPASGAGPIVAGDVGGGVEGRVTLDPAAPEAEVAGSGGSGVACHVGDRVGGDGRGGATTPDPVGLVAGPEVTEHGEGGGVGPAPDPAGTSGAARVGKEG